MPHLIPWPPTYPTLPPTPAGTLTEQGLELQGIVPITNAALEPMTHGMDQLPPHLPVLLATCHGLAWLGDTLVGDPLDQKLFAATGWQLHDDHDKDDAQHGCGDCNGEQAAEEHCHNHIKVQLHTKHCLFIYI